VTVWWLLICAQLLRRRVEGQRHIPLSCARRPGHFDDVDKRLHDDDRTGRGHFNRQLRRSPSCQAEDRTL